MAIALILLYSIILLSVCIMMGRKGRNLGKDREIGPVKGFWLGFLLGMIGLFIVKRSRPLLTSTPNAFSVTNEYPDANKTQSFDEPQLETCQGPPCDESLFTCSKSESHTYLDQLAIEVCLHGENLKKYEHMVTKQYDHKVYENMQRFVEEITRSHQRQLFTNTSIANLTYLSRNLGLSNDTVNKIVKHYTNIYQYQ